VKHCPVVLKRIDTPIFMFEAGNNTLYEKKPVVDSGE